MEPILELSWDRKNRLLHIIRVYKEWVKGKGSEEQNGLDLVVR